MATSGEWHESYEKMSEASREFWRAGRCVQEERQAVDCYNKGPPDTEDLQLRSILEHNRDEEIEHAMMALEYHRRNIPAFDKHMRTYLFSKGDIVAVEAKAEKK